MRPSVWPSSNPRRSTRGGTSCSAPRRRQGSPRAWAWCSTRHAGRRGGRRQRARRAALAAQHADRHVRRADDGEPLIRPLPGLAARSRRPSGGAAVTPTSRASRTDPPPRRRLPGLRLLDPDHSWEGGRTQFDGGKMDGFLRAGTATRSRSATTPRRTCRSLRTWRSAFTTFDRFFCSLLSSTYPNREYMHAGQSYGQIDNSLPTGIGWLPRHDDLRRAVARPASPTATSSPTSPSPRCGECRASPAPARSRSTTRAARRARCPRVSFVDPSFNGEDAGTSGDEHPHGDVRVGPGVHGRRRSRVHGVAAVQARRAVHRLRRVGRLLRPCRSRRACLTCAQHATSTRTSARWASGFPAIVVSPYARRGHVDHSIYGFESILKMIRYRFGLPPLTPARPVRQQHRARVRLRDIHSYAAPAADASAGDLMAQGRLDGPPCQSRRPDRERRGAKPHDLDATAHEGLPRATWIQVPTRDPVDDVPPPLIAGALAV